MIKSTELATKPPAKPLAKLPAKPAAKPIGDILIIDDEKDIRDIVSAILKDEQYTTRLAVDSESAFHEINQDPPAMLILDLWLKAGQYDGIDILKKVRKDHPDIPVVIISGHANVDIAVAAIKQGAFDFIEKPFNLDALLVVVARAMEVARLRKENLALRDSQDMDEMIGSSTVFKTFTTQLNKVAKGNARVMITGPTGSGKELAARYIHKLSERKDAPFIIVNSASIDSDKMEQTLFGTEGAAGNSTGLLEQAHGGVLFFDEIADMPIETQSKILRMLLEPEFTRVGGKDKVRVDIRVLSATSKNIEREIAQGKFREELYHRLNVIPIHVPSLEQRCDDIPELAQHFIDVLHRDQGLPKRDLTEAAANALQMLFWPGNLRQLRNMMERILILGSDSRVIDEKDLPIHGADHQDGSQGIKGNYAILSLREARELFEREYLIVQVNRFGGNISKTSNFVGMERSALHRKLKTLNVITDSTDGARTARIGAKKDAKKDAPKNAKK